MKGVDAVVGRSKGFLSGFTNGQKTIVVALILILVLGAVALARWAAQPTLAPLYGNLDGTDANAIVEALGAQGVQYELADGGATILVPQDKVYDLRIQLSGEGLPANEGSAGYAILDEQGLTATDFQQNVAYRRALEGELSKTLTAMDGVNNAVVHLALPEPDIFADDQGKPTASVLLGLAAGKSLERGQVDSVTRLVAGSVENLSPDDVTVSDQTGKLLSGSGGAGGGAGAANEADEQTAKYEDRVSAAAQKVLDTVVGPGKSVVRVNAALNFDATDTTRESYVAPSPTLPPLSESTTTEQYNGNGNAAGGTLGTTLPDLTPSTGGSGAGSYAKSQRTVNNSVGKEVQRITGTPGTVERLTVAVVLDSKAAAGVNPAQVQQVVANAVGLDAQRGDAVNVEAMPFDTTAAATAAKQLAEAESAAKTAGYISMGKQAGLWLLGLLLLFFILRRGKKKNDDATVDVTATSLPGAAEGVVLPPGAIESGLYPALGGGRQTDADRDRMRQEVSELVDNQPDDVAAMLQGWLDERASA